MLPAFVMPACSVPVVKMPPPTRMALPLVLFVVIDPVAVLTTPPASPSTKRLPSVPEPSRAAVQVMLPVTVPPATRPRKSSRPCQPHLGWFPG